MECGGVQALVHRLRGQPSNRRLPSQLYERIEDKYRRFNDSHLTEKLHDIEKLRISRASVRRLRAASFDHGRIGDRRRVPGRARRRGSGRRVVESWR